MALISTAVAVFPINALLVLARQKPHTADQYGPVYKLVPGNIFATLTDQCWLYNLPPAKA